MGSRKQLTAALSLLVDCATLYARTNEQSKRLANQALTNGIEISEDERATIRLAEPFAALAPEPASADVRCSSTSSMVELVAKCLNQRHDLRALERAHTFAKKNRRTELTEPSARLHKIEARLGPTKVARIVMEYLKGDTSRTLAERYGISKTTVIQLVIQAGHQPRPRGLASGR